MRMRMPGPRVWMHDAVEPPRGASADLEIMEDEPASRPQGAVRFAHRHAPRLGVEMMAAVGDEHTVEDVVPKEAPRGRLTHARQGLRMTGIDHELRDVGRVDRRGAVPH